MMWFFANTFYVVKVPSSGVSGLLVVLIFCLFICNNKTVQTWFDCILQPKKSQGAFTGMHSSITKTLHKPKLR